MVHPFVSEEEIELLLFTCKERLKEELHTFWSRTSRKVNVLHAEWRFARYDWFRH